MVAMTRPRYISYRLVPTVTHARDSLAYIFRLVNSVTFSASADLCRLHSGTTNPGGRLIGHGRRGLSPPPAGRGNRQSRRGANVANKEAREILKRNRRGKKVTRLIPLARLPRKSATLGVCRSEAKRLPSNEVDMRKREKSR